MKAPSVFAAQGSPRLLLHPGWPGRLHAWAQQLPRPRAILVVSSHWEEAPLTVGSLGDPVPLYYDYYGFPAPFYHLTWPAPPACDLAERIVGILEASRTVAHDPGRGLDHGAFIPLMLMFPEHDIPVVEISMPSLDPRDLLALGRQLAPLRDDGVLIFGTGLLTHAPSGARGDDDAPREPFVTFDGWVAAAVDERRIDDLVNYRTVAPHVRTVLPSHEHFAPLFVALGAAVDDLGDVTFPTTGFWRGNSMRSIEFR